MFQVAAWMASITIQRDYSKALQEKALSGAYFFEKEHPLTFQVLFWVSKADLCLHLHRGAVQI